MYYSLNDYFRKTYGTKGYKVSISGNMNCPNRDGLLSHGGCTFCTGSDEFTCKQGTVSEQIDRGIQLVKKKNGAGTYIAYFQDHTNTYAPVPYLKNIFTEATEHSEISVLSVATRPDCLPEEVITVLHEIALKKPVWVELGLQTIHEETAERICRHYGVWQYDQSVRKLHEAGIQVITHVILGLPGETPEMIYQTVDHLNEVKTDGVKFHMLHVLRQTPMESEYRQGLISTYSLPEYVTLLEGCLRRLHPSVVVHRLTGDGDKKKLIAPVWSGDKKHVLNYICRRFQEDHVEQGELLLDKFR